MRRVRAQVRPILKQASCGGARIALLLKKGAGFSKKKKWRVAPKEKADLLGQALEEKMTQLKNGTKLTQEEATQEMYNRFAEGEVTLEQPITPEEVRSAVVDLPLHRAAGPDLIPNEVYNNSPALYGELA